MSTYEVCATCRAAVVNCDPTCYVDDRSLARWYTFCQHGWFVATEEAAFGGVCECCRCHDDELYVLECDERNSDRLETVQP